MTDNPKRQTEREILKALISHHATVFDPEKQARLANAILNSGFTMTTPSDEEQNERLDRIERKVDRVIGWTGGSIEA